MNKPLLIYFIGQPGSGKTYFATRLADRLGAVRLNSDATRIAMFGSSEEVERIRKSKQESILYAPVFGAMNYSAQQIINSGHSVIYDAQATKRRDRKRHEKLAHECDAAPILVWIDTPGELAIKRGQEREQRDDSIVYSESKMRMLAELFSKNIDLPESDENLIKISGELPFEEQFKSFEAQLSSII